MSGKIDIRSLDLYGLESLLQKQNEKPYRAKQIYEWLWKKHAVSFSAMSNLSLELREKLEDISYIRTTKINSVLISEDGTIKVRFKLNDDNHIEGVLIPEKERVTACVSTQAGCALNCRFCATGRLGYKRDLGYDEIYDEVVLLRNLSEEKYGHFLTHIVYMGMGEPMMNYSNVIRSLNYITTDAGLSMSPKRITISTIGIPEYLRKLADEGIKCNLAISLHSANENKRTSIVPVTKKYSLHELSESIKYFYNRTGIRISYEYLLLSGINDTLTDAKEFAEFCRISPCKINLIEYNITEQTGFKKSDKKTVEQFASYLKSKNLVVNIRRSRGTDISAACGQLCLKENK